MAGTARQYGSSINLGANWQGPPQPVNGGRLSVGIEWTGTPTGTFALEASFTGNTWRAVPGASAEFTSNGNAQPAGADGGTILNFSGMPGTLWRLTYTRTSGTGSAIVYWRAE